MWIGLRDDVIEGVFYWNDGRVHQWESWSSIGDQPNGDVTMKIIHLSNQILKNDTTSNLR